MIALLLLIPSLAQDLPSEPMNRCSRERVFHTVETLTGLGDRQGGTPSGNASAAWVSRRLRGLGLSPQVVEDPEQWCHEVRSCRVTATVETEGSEPEVLELSRTLPYRFCPSDSGEAWLSVSLPTTGAYLGPRVPRRRETGERTPALVMVDPGDAWPRSRSLSEGLENETPTLVVAEAEGAALRDWIAAQRNVRVSWELETTAYRARPRSIVASLPARKGAPPGFFLVMAHGDSHGCGSGGNDNASGVAVLLEVARAWASAVREGALPGPAREVRFAVWGTHLHSSRAWLQRHLRDPGSPLIGVIDLHCLGFSEPARRLHFEPDDHLPNAALLRHIDELLTDAGGRLGLPERWLTNPALGGSDIGVFTSSIPLRSAGVPALTIFAAGSHSPMELQRTLGMPGESWRERAVVSIQHDPLVGTAGDSEPSRFGDDGALLEIAARTVLRVLPPWLESLDG